MTRLYLDFETFSEIDLFDVGGDRYSRHPSTRALMAAYAFDNEKVQQWVPAENQKMPRDLADALRDPAVTKSAWNAAFETTMLLNVLKQKVVIEQWRCTMALASTLSLPLALSKAGDVLGIPSDKKKDARGKALIRLFSMPIKPTKKRPYTRANFLTDPDEWEEFKAYNRQDIEAERAIWRRIRKWDMPDHEWAMWHLDQRINHRGIPINLDTVENAVRIIEKVREDRYAELSALTGVANPRARDQLLDWLQDHGYRFQDLKAGHVKREIESLEGQEGFLSDEEKTLLRVLQLRAEVSKSSVDKYFALQRATADDGNLRGCFQFAGAGRTWRWSGRIYQPQNLPRPAKAFEKPEAAIQAVTDLGDLTPEEFVSKYPQPMDAIVSCIRPVVQAPKGYVLVDADLNAIENRVLGWIANDKKILDVFENNRDPYVDFATYMFGEPYEKLYAEYKAGDKSKRTTAKPGVLGCGYMLSAGHEFENEKTGEIEATGLLGYGWNMGVKLTAEQAEHSVKTWRATFSTAVEFWYDLENAAKRCLRTGRETECNMIRFDRSGPFMRMLLPSGRALHYVRPRLEEKMMPWGKKKTVITYEGLNDTNQWVRIQTHPGKLTENADQAISRDLLANGIRLAEREGLKVRLHVHDQIAALVREHRADEDLALLIECMTTKPKWARDLPLGAAGAHTRYFLKD